jgi:hypothetical protein
MDATGSEVQVSNGYFTAIGIGAVTHTYTYGNMVKCRWAAPAAWSTQNMTRTVYY